MQTTRRGYLLGAGSLAAAGVAGCLDGPLSSDEVESGYAAFFALGDWTRAIVGDDDAVELPMSTGEAGHGWNPPGGITADIAGTDFFVYIDTPEFSWAQDIAEGLEADYDDVTVIDALAGLESELLERDTDIEHAGEFDGDPAAATVAEVELTAHGSGEAIADYHEDHWHGSLGDIEEGSSRSIGVVALDGDGQLLPLGEDLLVEGSSEDDAIVTVESRDDHLVVRGESTGTTEVAISIVLDDDVRWAAEEGVGVRVESDLDVEGATEFHDPHAWVDPVLAGEMVEGIAEGLAAADPDREEEFLENAAAYREDLAAVDEEFRSLLEAAEHTDVVLGGHDAFQYLEARYGLTVHTPTGITPDAEPSSSDVIDLIEVIDGAGIDTVLYDPFETPGDDDLPDEVGLLLDNSTATDAAPLTPIEGQTGEWADEGWGYVEQMQEVNIPNLAKALGVSTW